MKYMGSKNRIAKHILPIMLKERGDRTWVEPFVGGANMIDKVSGKRIGADLNPYLIEALKLIRDNPESLPDHVSEEMYQELKIHKHSNVLLGMPNEALAGYVGFTHSFAGKWFRGFARNKELDKVENEQNVSRRAKNNALKQSKNLKRVTFIHSSYKDLKIPDNSLIYCDPPYENTTGYKDAFNHSDFWQWCREKHTEGHKVFISEYNAPDDFICVWQKTLTTSFSTSESIKAVEKLFIFDDMY